MLRRCFPRRALQDMVHESRQVWNLEFGERAVTPVMHFNNKAEAVAMYHILDMDGKVVNASDEPEIGKDTCVKIIENMVRANTVDRILLDAQRQGRISFFMTGFGEEAAVVASAAALKFEDFMYMQYREAAALHYRGYGIEQMISQCMGNIEDNGKGRQMPIHYGSPEHNVMTISSPLATQIPQAAGSGYAYKLDELDRICMCYFGDGTASEGDFHAGLNFAATTGAQTLFFCRNNGYAISTPTKDQYHGDGIVTRGVAYGIPSIRVDGTDVLAVYAATKEARKIIFEQKTPVLIEAMTYRVSHHSTSDDSSRYRAQSEIDMFNKEFDPILRFEKYLVGKGWWAPEDSKAVADAARKKVFSELKRQELLPNQPHTELFTDTTKEMTPVLREQRDATLAHFERNKGFYGAH
jgi:2-oxoisovalerate dehydrogenase E1 component alpha subunit